MVVVGLTLVEKSFFGGVSLNLELNVELEAVVAVGVFRAFGNFLETFTYVDARLRIKYYTYVLVRSHLTAARLFLAPT